MDRKLFFAKLRPYFSGRLSARQVSGIESLLDTGKSLPIHHMANVLANVRRETGGGMFPVKETVLPSHKDQNPSDNEVQDRLDAAWRSGNLKGVKTPYWRGVPSWFGRGQLQVTHQRNYAKFGITNPHDALELDVSAMIAVKGMREGVFTGKKLADFDFPAALDLPPPINPRRIVNGQDGSDAEVAKFHRQFAKALQAAGWNSKPSKGFWTDLFAALLGFLKGR